MDLRAINNALGLKSKEKTNKTGKNSTPSNNQRNTFSTRRNNNTITENSNTREYKYLKLLVNRIRKEGRYFKCLKTRYRSSDDSALYKNIDPLIKE